VGYGLTSPTWCVNGKAGWYDTGEHRRRTLGVVRILLADDHDIVRHGLRQLLEHEPGWEVCGEARDGRSAVELGPVRT
jgi:hypothetical protein